PGQITAREINPALGDFHAAVAEGRFLPEAAPGAGNLVALATLAQVIEVELEKVVSLNRVRILRGEHVVELGEQRLFGGVGFLGEHEQPDAFAEAQTDGEHAVVGLGGVAETAVRRAGLDVELATPELGKRQIGEQVPALLQQVLALQRTDRIDAAGG